MAYGTANGVADRVVDYDKMVTADADLPNKITRFYAQISDSMDTIISASSATVPVVAPSYLVGKLDKIADDLVTCEVLKRHTTQKDKDTVAGLNMYCVDPWKELEKLLEDYPGLFSDTATSGPALMLSNTVGKDRTMTLQQKIDGEGQGDAGSLDDWNDVIETGSSDT